MDEIAVYRCTCDIPECEQQELRLAFLGMFQMGWDGNRREMFVWEGTSDPWTQNSSWRLI